MSVKTYSMNEEQQKLVENNINLVYTIIRKYCAHLPLSWEEKVSAGYYALCRAAIGYNKGTGYEFSTYAAKAIVRHVNHSCKNEIRHTGRHISLNNRCSYEDDTSSELVDFIIDEESNIENDIINKLLCERIMRQAPTLTELTLRGLKLRELASEKGVSKQMIGAKKLREIAKLKEEFGERWDWIPMDVNHGASMQIKY